MKLFAKIFFYSMLVFSIAFQVTGYLLISYSYENAISQEKKFAFNQYQYDKFMIQSDMYSNAERYQTENSSSEYLENKANSLHVPMAFYNENKQVIFSNLNHEIEDDMLESNLNHRMSYRVLENEKRTSIVVCGKIEQSGQVLYLAIETDISSVIDNQELMLTYFQRIYSVVLIFSLILIAILSLLVIKPIKIVSNAAKRITRGNYSERVEIPSNDEIGNLAVDFNIMAETIEGKIRELSEQAMEKEDFVANFAHELKTPMTSVIGYADMLYQTELPREQVKEAAEYIFHEGMRLESLSLKLMDIMVLKKLNFVMEELSAKEIFENIVHGMEPVCLKKNVLLHCNIEDAYIQVEFDLFKTLILNLLDNAIKAESRDIWIVGKKEQNTYHIAIMDNGIGISEAEIRRITEAFYMVDKSRAHKQHGAGLGLALAEKIAAIHGTKLQFESDGKSGTCVKINLIGTRRTEL